MHVAHWAPRVPPELLRRGAAAGLRVADQPIRPGRICRIGRIGRIGRRSRSRRTSSNVLESPQGRT
jgi:hypothetical protein